jgi:hypothetical protein
MPDIHRGCTASVQRVKRSSLAAMSAAVALGTCAAGGLFAGPAFAYPPGTGLEVAASAVGNPTSHNHQQFAVQVINGKPGCTVKISGGEKPVTTTIGSDGTASATVGSEYHGGKVLITAQTVHCKGANEKASTPPIYLSPGQVQAPQSVHHKRRVDIVLTDWLPHRRITVVATNGKKKQKFTGWPDSKGSVTVHFTPDVKGTWAVIVMQDGVSSSVTIKVS